MENDEAKASSSQMQVCLKRHEIKPPKMKCANGHQVKQICTKEGCDKPALYCSSQDCSVCSGAHPYHMAFKVKDLFQTLSKREVKVRPFYKKMFRFNLQIIDKIRSWNEKMARKIIYGSLEDQNVERLEEIIMKETPSEDFKGKEAKELYYKADQEIVLSEDSQKMLERRLEVERDKKMVEEHLKNLTFIFDCLVQNRNMKSELKENHFVLQSNLLRMCLANIYGNTAKYYENIRKNQPYSEYSDPDRIASDKEYFTFLWESLYKPVRAELIFTASQNNFQLAKFHEKCDGVENTLTIVRTEFGKTIFAFAAPKWNSSNTYANDTTGKSCLLLLELKKKCSLTNAAYSIYCNSSYGPTFGGGHDLFICDGCDKSNSSYCSFSNSYNCNGEFTNNQIAHTTICGAPNGRNFKVIDYEVHKLIYA